MLANPPLCHCPLALWRPSGGPVDQREYDREIVLNVMGCVEGVLNVMSNAVVAATTTTETNGIEDQENIQQMVSSLITNRYGLVNLSENVDIGRLQDGWRVEIVSRQIPINENVSEDYLETLKLAEDIIVIRLIEDYRESDDGFRWYIQIIWNSIFSWRQVMQHLQYNTYRFNFLHERIAIGNNNARSDEVNMSPREVVDGFPDVIIGSREDNGNGNGYGNDDEALCTGCYENLTKGENAKQLACTHVFHSTCILQWFSRKINCPTCRYEPPSRR